MSDERIKSERDFVVSPKYKNSLAVMIDIHPDGYENDVIGKVLNLTQDEVRAILSIALAKLGRALGVRQEEGNDKQ